MIIYLKLCIEIYLKYYLLPFGRMYILIIVFYINTSIFMLNLVRSLVCKESLKT